jgi:murein DD-endopeptidase MepM/ murein hydrolase activator NlpD
MLDWPSAVRDGRQLLSLVRTHTPFGPGIGMLRPPITIVDGQGFGRPQTWIGGSPVEEMMDGLHGEHHRGLDYEVPVGTVVMAPAAATVLFAGNLTLTGKTLVLDHGNGVVSSLFHLYRIDVREGDRVESRAAVGLSGETGLAVSPQVQWRVYLHGVAVDPRALDRPLD